MPTTSGTSETFKTAKTMVNYIPLKSLGIYSTLASFCAASGTFDPLYLKGSTLGIYSIPENKLVEIVPTFNYFEVAESGEIVDKVASEPAAIAISGAACRNFAVGIYLKYKLSKEGIPTAAQFSIYYKTTQTFALANIPVSQLYAVVVRGDKDF